MKSRKKKSLPELRIQNLIEVFAVGIRYSLLNFRGIFPFTFLMALIGYAIQPYTIPTLVDAVDFLALGLFTIGSMIIAIIHTSTVYRLNALLLCEKNEVSNSIKFGLSRGGSVFITGILFLLFVIIGLALFVMPGLYFGVAFSLALFLVVLKDENSYDSAAERIKESFLDSFAIAKNIWWLLFSVIFMLAAITFGFEWLLQKLLIDQIVLSSLLIVLVRATTLTVGYTCMLLFLYAYEGDLELISEATEG